MGLKAAAYGFIAWIPTFFVKHGIAGLGLYIRELFSTELRMCGAGICSAAGRLMSTITPYLVVELFTRLGVLGVVSAIAGLLILQAIVIAILGIETRKRSLENLRPEISLPVLVR
jgi:putative MFS transporter